MINIDNEKSIDKIIETVYDRCSEENGGMKMLSKEYLDAALKMTNKKQAYVAAKMGWSPQQLNAKIARGTLRVDEFFEFMDAIGVEVTLTVKDTGENVIKRTAGAGRRVKRMVDRVTYDTYKSSALANNFYADGKHQYNDGRARELYIDMQGRYFFAEYSEKEGESDRINPVSAADAADFIERYGTDLHKGPDQS